MEHGFQRDYILRHVGDAMTDKVTIGLEDSGFTAIPLHAYTRIYSYHVKVHKKPTL